MVPYINYIENHFLIKRRRQSRWPLFFPFLFLPLLFVTYKVTFLFGKLKVQERPTISSTTVYKQWEGLYVKVRDGAAEDFLTGLASRSAQSFIRPLPPRLPSNVQNTALCTNYPQTILYSKMTF